VIVGFNTNVILARQWVSKCLSINWELRQILCTP